MFSKGYRANHHTGPAKRPLVNCSERPIANAFNTSKYGRHRGGKLIVHKKNSGTRASGSLSCCSHLIWSRLPTSFLIALSVHNRTSVEWQIKSLQREWRLCSPYVVRRTPPERASILSSLERFNHCAIWADFLVLPWLCSNEIGYEHCWQDN